MASSIDQQQLVSYCMTRMFHTASERRTTTRTTSRNGTRELLLRFLQDCNARYTPDSPYSALNPGEGKDVLQFHHCRTLVLQAAIQFYNHCSYRNFLASGFWDYSTMKAPITDQLDSEDVTPEKAGQMPASRPDSISHHDSVGAMDIIFILDESGSMASVGRQAVLDAMNTFVDQQKAALDDGATFTLYRFSDCPALVVMRLP